mmetsp:Transcript_43150/g.99983  ORF Transcript_43150/g.99983 Transcript_43150/m.99983 type:complete len:115 (-) Transcript_43150:219-563(-)
MYPVSCERGKRRTAAAVCQAQQPCVPERCGRGASQLARLRPQECRVYFSATSAADSATTTCPSEMPMWTAPSAMGLLQELCDDTSLRRLSSSSSEGLTRVHLEVSATIFCFAAV